MSPRFRFPIWLWAVLAVTTGVSIWVAIERYKAEASNRAVHLIVDMPDVRLMAGVSGSKVWTILDQLKQSGATGVALAEETIDDWIYSGKIKIEIGEPTRLVFEDPKLVPAIQSLVDRRLHPGEISAVFVDRSLGSEYPVSARLADIKSFGLGFNSDDVFYVKQSGLSVVARLTNQSLGDRQALDAMLDSAKVVGAEGILFAGDQVLGRRDLILYAAEQIRALGFWIGPVEFTSQGGLPRITKELQGRLVRVHSMVAAEMDRNEPPDIIDRYVRAVVERNTKGLFLRPISNSAENPLASFSDFIAAIRDGLRRDGYEAKPARPELPPARPLWAAILVGIGVAAVGGFLVLRIAGSDWGLATGGLLLLLTAGLGIDFGLKYLALAGAVVFPILAMLAAFDRENSSGDSKKWIAAFFWITALSVIGGLHIAALLTLPSYSLRIEQFFGVKVAHFLPPVLIALYLVFSENDRRNLLNGVVRWVDVAVMVLIMAAVFVMLSRTGNDAPGDVSAIELKLRNFLDRVLPERPRTKEFLFGHPALVVALGMAFSGRRAWLPLLAFIAAVGQVSVLNTFCHLHTPIEVTLLRVLVGFVMGGLIGLAALWALNWISRSRVTA